MVMKQWIGKKRREKLGGFDSLFLIACLPEREGQRCENLNKNNSSPFKTLNPWSSLPIRHDCDSRNKATFNMYTTLLIPVSPPPRTSKAFFLSPQGMASSYMGRTIFPDMENQSLVALVSQDLIGLIISALIDKQSHYPTPLGNRHTSNWLATG